MKKDKRIFYGWWIVIATMANSFSMAAAPFGIILKKLMAEFGSGRGMVSLAPSFSIIGGAIAGLFVGKLIMRHRPRIFMLWGVMIGGVSLLLLSMAHSLWHLYALYFLNGVVMSGAGVLPEFTILSKWFNRKWGTAVGLTMTGFSLGYITLSPIIGIIAENYGWRATYVFAGVLLFVINLPLILFVIKDSPDSMGLFPDGDNPSEYVDIDAGESAQPVDPASTSANIGVFSYLKRISLWLVGFGFAFVTMGDQAITQHQVSFFTDMNIPATIAASVFGITMGISGIGRLIAGWLSDKFSSRYVSILFILIALTGMVILMRAYSMSMVWLFVFVYGLGTGASTALLPLVIRDVFGAAGFSILFALLDIFFKGGSMLGVPLAGFIFDATGSYSVVFTMVVVFYTLGIVSLYFAFGARPKPCMRKYSN